MNRPELSIVVPVLNEAAGLPAFLAMLGRQEDVAMELILSDGGSGDGTLERALELKEELPYPVAVVATAQGRGRQLNAGAARAAAETLLFLHADSILPEPRTLRGALDLLQIRLGQRGDYRAAGHFPLRFVRKDHAVPSLGFSFYEVKARLDRPECTHGDQGFLLRREFFRDVGPFDESLPILEDTRLAEKIRASGEWILLPGEILTSARRFETEGLYERQLLNALVMNFAAQGWEDFFSSVQDIYRTQDRSGTLCLSPFLDLIRRLEGRMSLGEWWWRWYRTGGYVRSHAWQLALAMDVRRQFAMKIPVGRMTHPWLNLFDRWWDLLTNHPPGRTAAMILTWLWFRRICRRRRQIEMKSRPDAGLENS